VVNSDLLLFRKDLLWKAGKGQEKKRISIGVLDVTAFQQQDSVGGNPGNLLVNPSLALWRR